MKGLPLLLVLGAIGSGVGHGGEAPVNTAPLKAPAAPLHMPSEHEVLRLRNLVEAVEKAVAAEDWDAADARADEAESLLDTWKDEALERPALEALVQRLQVAEELLEDDEELPGDDGLKQEEEVVGLASADLHSELERVKLAEQGAAFDFPIDLNDKVLTWVHLFTNQKRGFMEGALSRGTRYLPMVRQIFQEEGVPQDLAYLAVIESGFKNTARSYAEAVGMWQFIRSTGRIYGLKGNAWIEERRDPVKAARASARYLKHLYESSGDWYLALVGYNAGPLTTERAASNLGSRNFWDMHRSPWLRNQTKNYVPELCAAILVGRFPERYGLKVPQLPPYVYETVEVDRMTSLSVLAKYAETDVEALKDLNPELLRATTPPGKYTLRVPPGTSGIIARALSEIPSGQRLDFQFYVLRRGDTLAKVSARFKVTADDLLSANGITKAQFRPGRRVQVPPTAAVPISELDLKPKTAPPVKPLPPIPQLPTEAVTDNLPSASSAPVSSAHAKPAPSVSAGSLPEVPRTVSTPSVPYLAPARAPEPRATAEVSKPKVHVVKRGETLFSISERYGLDQKLLKKWNKIKKNRVQVGQRLRLQKP